VEVAPGIHRLSGGGGELRTSSPEGGRYVVVDAGVVPGDWDRFARTLTSLRSSVEDLDAVLLTHAHSGPHRILPSAPAPPRMPVVRVHQADADVARTGEGAQ
jgi:glyoxylase-like metal-dependent hydrolase (beta-lactamase superfamily II)